LLWCPTDRPISRKFETRLTIWFARWFETELPLILTSNWWVVRMIRSWTGELCAEPRGGKLAFSNCRR